MDPNEAMKNLLDACVDNDREAAYSALEALIHWINHDGVLPKVATSSHRGMYYWVDFERANDIAELKANP